MTAANGAQQALAVVPSRWRKRGAAIVVVAGIVGASVGFSGSDQHPDPHVAVQAAAPVLSR
jgi:uncharacterized protein GlcG (DUF336 family)